MFRFQELDYLFALAIVPVLIVLFIAVIYWRRKKIKQLGDERLVESQILGFIPGRATLKFILLTIGLVFTIVGLANLQAGDKIEKVQRKGVDVVIALDVSKSMLATDIQPNRLTRAQQLIMTLTDKMQNDRVALIVFAGRSYLQVPLTVDYAALKMMVQNVSTDMVPTQGTVIGDAVDMAVQSFSQTELKYKSLIVISDGEDHDEAALKKVQDAAEKGVVVHTVGIGSPQGTTLYDPETKSVKLDEQGAPVISKLNEEELRSLAAAGHGTYSLLQNTNDVANKLVSNLDGMEQKSLGSVVYTDYTSYFQYFILVGFLAFLAEWLIPGAKRKRNKAKDAKSKPVMVKKPTPPVAAASAVLIMILLSTTAMAQNNTNTLLQQGNKLYDQKRYDEATANYLQALKKDPNNATGLFNLGSALYQKKQYDSSRKLMAATADAIKDKGGKSAAHYNIGNTYMAQRKWEDAIASYKNTLRNNPQDADAKYNLSYAEEMLKKDKNDKKDKQKQDQQKQDKPQQDKDKKDKDKKEKQDQQKENDKDKKEQQDQQPQSQPSKLTEQQAEQMLNAVQQQEKKLQDKLKKEKGMRVKMDKDW
ncbi:hypothetical protein CJD36_011925 [Flavipsychrobacter stenotrophus]|uniref:VWFA domain-containing protein n=1 Tax=Flavipsychrobacter stenotrophus TaxID=2077091 RepID=A0A2S7SUV9_9BACT|nr:VWA domain-containing protein [Flavipsychrobacter stenotrophus]PQJ10673.1 hypothetical protein CJD36_011925 [Flavipsychrobacter stenotrophus]